MAAFFLIVFFCRSIQILGHRRTKKVVDDESLSESRASTRGASPVEQMRSKEIGGQLERSGAIPVLESSRDDARR